MLATMRYTNWRPIPLLLSTFKLTQSNRYKPRLHTPIPWTRVFYLHMSAKICPSEHRTRKSEASSDVSSVSFDTSDFFIRETRTTPRTRTGTSRAKVGPGKNILVWPFWWKFFWILLFKMEYSGVIYIFERRWAPNVGGLGKTSLYGK